MLFNEPKLLKFVIDIRSFLLVYRFSALQRAEIAEIDDAFRLASALSGFSALQRAEIAEILRRLRRRRRPRRFQCSSTSRNC